MKKNANEMTIEEIMAELENMHNAMVDSIKNASKVATQQKMLIKIIENSKEVKLFEDFIKSLKEQTNDINDQITTLTNRINIYNDIVEDVKDENSAKTLQHILYFLGVFSGK